METITSTNRNHIRAMWNLLTDLMIQGNHRDAQIIREAIKVAEKNELDEVGKF